MATQRSDITDLLVEGLAAVTGLEVGYPDLAKPIYTHQESHKAQEYEDEMVYPAGASYVAEGGMFPTAQMMQRIRTTFVHKKVGVEVIVTQEMLEDNLYEKEFPLLVEAGKQDLLSAQNVLSMDIFNHAFDTNVPIADGQPLCSAAHPILGGTASNLISTYADFTEAGIEEGLIKIGRFPQQNGILAGSKGKGLLVPLEGTFTAERLLKSGYRPDTANNDINAIMQGNFLTQGALTNPYIISGSYWFILTTQVAGFKHYTKGGTQHLVNIDPVTTNYIAKLWQRYSYGATTFRACAGSPGV